MALGDSDAVDDSSSNSRVIVKLLSKHDEVVKKRLEEGLQNATLLGHDPENELVAVKGMKIIEKIQTEVSEAQYYTIITNESKDISKKVNYSAIRLCYIIHERFVEYKRATELTATALSEIICW